jgi:molybdopterin synthase sulfur carrier subunit
MTRISIRYFAAAADAAGCIEETVEMPEGPTLGDLKRLLSVRHGTRMAGLLTVATFLQEGEATRDLLLAAAPEVDILPPFAGG